MNHSFLPRRVRTWEMSPYRAPYCGKYFASGVSSQISTLAVLSFNNQRKGAGGIKIKDPSNNSDYYSRLDGNIKFYVLIPGQRSYFLKIQLITPIITVLSPIYKNLMQFYISVSPPYSVILLCLSMQSTIIHKWLETG